MLPQNYLCESGSEKMHDGRGNTLSVGKGKSGSTLIFMVFTDSEGVIIERHRALLVVVGDVEES